MTQIYDFIPNRSKPLCFGYNFVDMSNLEISIDGESYDLDDDISALLSSLPSQTNAKGVFTDNNAFCLINANPYFTEIKSNQYGVYFWAHVWNDPYLIEQPYLFFKINFGENGAKKNLAFNAYAPIEAEITYPISTSYVNNTINTIFDKNDYAISVNFIDKEVLEWDDLYNYIKLNDPPNLPGTGFSRVDNDGLSEKGNFIQYFYLTEEASIYIQQTHRDYVLGYVLSHEFMHQIIKKSYYYIFSTLNTLKFGNGDHVNMAKNILFAGDGLASHKEFLLPEDLNKPTQVLGDLLYFSGKYIPKSNNQNTNDWERIVDSHRRLIIDSCVVMEKSQYPFS